VTNVGIIASSEESAENGTYSNLKLPPLQA